MRQIIGYTFEIIASGETIRQGSDWDIYDTESEAEEAGYLEIDDIINFEEGYDESDRDDLSVNVIEVEEEEVED